MTNQTWEDELKNFVKGLDLFMASMPGPTSADVSLKKQMDSTKKTKFDRKAYYSQTEACAKFNITPKVFQHLCARYNIQQVNKEVDMGFYKVTTRYVLKEDFDKINIQL